MALEFWFEFASTYSYPAAMRIERLSREQGVRVCWRAFLLGPIFRAQGWQDSPFNLYPAKGAYMWRDLERICEAQGIAFRKPAVFPQNSLLAARIACVFTEAPWLPEFVRLIYRANFEQNCDISDPSVVGAILLRCARTPAAILAAAQSPEAKRQLRSRTDQAVSSGIFGAPSFIVDGELFWGNDRLEDAFRCATAQEL